MDQKIVPHTYCISPFFKGPYVNCTGSTLIPMGGICCQSIQVNAGGVCADQCPTAQVMTSNRICEECPDNTIGNAAGNKCLDDCVVEGEIINAAGTRCLSNCTAGGEITNAAGTACLVNCTAGGETADSNDDHQCDINCADLNQILSTTGDLCIPDCNYGIFGVFGYILNSQGTYCLPS